MQSFEHHANWDKQGDDRYVLFWDEQVQALSGKDLACPST